MAVKVSHFPDERPKLILENEFCTPYEQNPSVSGGGTEHLSSSSG